MMFKGPKIYFLVNHAEYILSGSIGAFLCSMGMPYLEQTISLQNHGKSHLIIDS